MIRVTPHITLDEDELVVSFQKASGPGGQNVNKVETAAQLRFDARRSPSLPDAVAIRLIAQAGQKATKDGVIVIHAQRFRSQEMNKADAIERLVAMIVQAAHVPKARRATKPTKASKERRLAGKAVRSGVKSGRGRVRSDD